MYGTSKGRVGSNTYYLTQVDKIKGSWHVGPKVRQECDFYWVSNL